MVLNVNANQAWGVIAAGGLAYELECKEGELRQRSSPALRPGIAWISWDSKRLRIFD